MSPVTMCTQQKGMEIKSRDFQIKSNHVYCETDDPIHIILHAVYSNIAVVEPPLSSADQAARLSVSIIWNTST